MELFAELIEQDQNESAQWISHLRAGIRTLSGTVNNVLSLSLIHIWEDRRVERNGRRIELTPREFALLDVMIQNAGHPVSRSALFERVWNTASEPSTNIVDVYMKYVRDKVDHPGEPRLLHTVRGFGYELGPK